MGGGVHECGRKRPGQPLAPSGSGGAGVTVWTSPSPSVARARTLKRAVVGDDVGVDVPEDPSEGGEGRGELGVEPGLSAVDGDFETVDAAVAGEGDAVDAGHAEVDGLAGGGDVDAAGGFHAGFLGPAALLPEAEDLLVEESDLGDPFGVFDAVFPGGEEAEGEAVAVGGGGGRSWCGRA